MRAKLIKLLFMFCSCMVLVCFAQTQTPLTTTQPNTIEFFYYGPGAEEDVVIALIGHKPIHGRPGILEGYKLGIQDVKDIPNVKISGIPVTAREIVTKAFGPNFQMYVAHKGKGEIKGMVWTLTPEDLNAIKAWELVDLNWYSLVPGTVVFADGTTEQVLTIAVHHQKIEKNVNGLDYDLYLGQGPVFKAEFLQKCQSFRQQYLKNQPYATLKSSQS